MPTLIADTLSKRFGRRLLFRGLSFNLEGGGVLSVTGANGSGKSTLLRLLARLELPTAGQVRLRVDGADVEAERHPLMAGLVAPYMNVYDGFTARENLAFLARVRRLDRARIAQTLDFVALTARADDPVATFSSGLKQRVRLAAALIADPPLLLLDEPATNLDDAGRELVRRIVERQRAAGRLLVLATNDAAEASLGDRSLRIEDYR